MIAVPDWYLEQGTGGSLLDHTTGNSFYTTTNSATTQYIYRTWITTQSAAVTTTIWSSWTEDPFYGGTGSWYANYPSRTPSYGELARVEHPPVPHDAHVHRARQDARARAEERADELLMSLLNPDQLRQYRAAKAFDVCAKSGRRYRLTRAMSGSIKLIGPDGRAAATYCAHLQDTRIPIPDHLIAQKFLIEHHEEEFLRIANRS